MNLRYFLAAVLAAGAALAQTPSGRWDATVTIGTLKVPFQIHFEGEGAAFTGSLVNGDARIRSKPGSYDGKTARLEFDKSGARLEATMSNGDLKGTFGAEKSYQFRAFAFCTCGFAGEAGPDIQGAWDVPDAGWKLSIRRMGEDTLATLTRGGDNFGPVSGRFNGTFFELSYFDGTRAAVLEIEPSKDKGLDIAWMEPGAAPKKAKAVRAASN